jgi:dTMP kinase
VSVAHGRFIVLEGGDGSGKSTQARALVRRLEAVGLTVVPTFEPGATAVGRAVRAVVLDGPAVPVPRAEALLMAADRAQHVAEVVEPALTRGAWVVSDRFTPSSLAYQGIARGLGVTEVEQLSAWASDGVSPDLVVVLDVPDAVGDARRGDEDDRMERERREFHAGVRHAYRHLAATHGWTVVDGSGSPEDVERAVWAEVERCLAPGRTDP